jgi:hypothetical protein
VQLTVTDGRITVRTDFDEVATAYLQHNRRAKEQIDVALSAYLTALVAVLHEAEQPPTH